MNRPWLDTIESGFSSWWGWFILLLCPDYLSGPPSLLFSQYRHFNGI